MISDILYSTILHYTHIHCHHLHCTQTSQLPGWNGQLDSTAVFAHLYPCIIRTVLTMWILPYAYGIFSMGYPPYGSCYFHIVWCPTMTSLLLSLARIISTCQCGKYPIYSICAAPLIVLHHSTIWRVLFIIIINIIIFNF